MNNDMMHRYFELGKRTEITNTEQYAYEWECLAAEFSAAGMINLSDNCHARAMQYRQLAPMMPAFQRVSEDQNFVRIEPL